MSRKSCWEERRSFLGQHVAYTWRLCEDRRNEHGALQVREDFLVGPTLPGTSFWGIPSYPKSLGIQKGRGVHWKEQNPHSICSGLHWSCEGNLSVLDLQCRALVMLPFGGSQAPSFLGHSALLHPSAVKTQMVSQGWGLCWVLKYRLHL